jgi:hypothetical protein
MLLQDLSLQSMRARVSQARGRSRFLEASLSQLGSELRDARGLCGLARHRNRFRVQSIRGQDFEEAIKILTANSPAPGRADGSELDAMPGREQGAALNPSDWRRWMAVEKSGDVYGSDVLIGGSALNRHRHSPVRSCIARI